VCQDKIKDLVSSLSRRLRHTFKLHNLCILFFFVLKQKIPRSSSQSVRTEFFLATTFVAFKNLKAKKGTNLAASVNHSIVKAQISAPLQWMPLFGQVLKAGK